ncbi:hypothetical protein M2262_000267 [Pseudomonas sp. BIGb0408]|uniref:CDP-Glycerol:Poly(Glycerophosphate) glycerophosphotransferase n=1 Tax=Phytopseudomonas flavescens TaxID=29435 RepID=A0A7Y9XPN8_9GAMM|nr:MULTISPECIES: hypothetical protein [Pseudomonas]MCW2290217.1 hypothetical protein [Pseudomonas sp. BIGb0408]NYH75210.1 hypothetical protein [Pseudomonas flavescens]
MYSLYAKTKENLKHATYAGQSICNPASAVLAHLFFDNRPALKKIRRAIKLIRLTPRYSCRDELTGDTYIWHCDRDDQTRLALGIGRELASDRKLSTCYIPAIKEDAYKSLDWSAMYTALKIVRTCKQPVVERFYIFSALCYTIKHMKAIERYGITERITSLVSYNSANIPECFLVSACRQRGIRTYSLQHGLYHRYRNESPIDIINYENVTAQTLLVWSEFCRAEIDAFHRDRGQAADFEIQVAGYINPPHQQPVAIERSSSAGPHILCLLPGKRYVADSVKLLSELAELPENYQLTIRLHPLLAGNAALIEALPARATLDDSSTLTQTLATQRYDLAVGFNTTSLFEVTLFGVPCAVYRAPSLNLETQALPAFTNAGELITLLRSTVDVSMLADYLLGASLFRYREITHAGH